MSFSTHCQNFNTTVVLTQNCSSTVESQQQPLFSLNQIVGCDHRQIIKHQSIRKTNNNGEHLPLSMLVKKNCQQCGAFISRSGIPTLKERYCNFVADISPQENYENLLEDECQQSHFHFYQNYIKDLSEQDITQLNNLRSVNIERIFYFGDKLKQQSQTVYLACAYFDFLLFRQFLQDKQSQTNLMHQKTIQQRQQRVENSRMNHSISNNNNNDSEINMMLGGASSLCQTPINEKVRDRHMNLKAQMCLLLASKYDELDDYIPMIRDFQKLSRYEFAYKDCQEEEEVVLKQLGWSLGFITPYHIIESLIQQGVIFEDDKLKSDDKLGDIRYLPFTEERLRSIRKQTEYFCRLAVSSGFVMQSYKPSYIAVACILAARLTCQVVPWQNEKLIELTQMNIYANQELRDCFDKLYMLHDETYVPFKLSLTKNNKLNSKFKSTISTCDANTLENTHINGTQLKKSKVLEQNQNITNDSIINSASQKNLRDQDTQPRHAEQFNYEMEELGENDVSIISSRKLPIDQNMLPESHIANRQSQINLGLNQVMQTLSSNRSSITNINTNKFRKSENRNNDGSITNRISFNQKKQSVNKENQESMKSLKIAVQNENLSKQEKLTQGPSQIIKQENSHYKIGGSTTLEQTKTFNTSQIFQVMPVNQMTRCNTNISHSHSKNQNPNHTHSHTNSSNMKTHMKQNSVNIDIKNERNQSLTNLNIINKQNSSSLSQTKQLHDNSQHQQVALQQKTILQKLGHISNKMSMDYERSSIEPYKKQTLQNQRQKTAGGIQINNNKNSQSRKLSTCSNTSVTKLQANGSQTRKTGNQSYINNQKLGLQNNDYFLQGPITSTKLPKSSRNSTSIGLTETQVTKDAQFNDQKLEELRLKYQTDNTIYEKKKKSSVQATTSNNIPIPNVIATQTNNNIMQGRNHQQHSMLSGFHAHSKTYATLLNPTGSILNKTTVSRERSISECELYQNSTTLASRKSIDAQQQQQHTQQQQRFAIGLRNFSNNTQYLQSQQKTYDDYHQVKNTIVMEDDNEEGDKSNILIVESTTNANIAAVDVDVCADEMIVFDNSHSIGDDQQEQIDDDDSVVVVKKPTYSRQSKSIENVNKFVSQTQRRKSTSNSKANIIDIYKRQYQQLEKKEHVHQQHTNSRNMLPSQQQTRVATIDLQNIQRPQSHIQNINNSTCTKTSTNFIKRNINHVATLNHQLQQSIDNTTITNTTNEQYNDIQNNIQSKRNSRCSNQVQPLTTANKQTKAHKAKLSSQFVKQSLSKRRASENSKIIISNNNNNNNSTLNQSQNNQAINSSSNNQSLIRKSTQQNTIRLLLNHKSQANIIQQRKSIDPKLKTSNQNLKDVKLETAVTLDKIDNNCSNLNNRNLSIKSANLSACSSKVHLKERSYQRFMVNPETNTKQFFTAFTKNFKNTTSITPIQQIQNQKLNNTNANNNSTIKINVISASTIDEKHNSNSRAQSLLQQLRSQQQSTQQQLKQQQQIMKVKSSRQHSNTTTSCDINMSTMPTAQPPLSHRSSHNPVLNTSSQQALIKFQKFQARKPVKNTQNHSLIERALMKKSQLVNMLKPYSDNNIINNSNNNNNMNSYYQAATAQQTLDNTCESTYEDKRQSYGNSNNGKNGNGYGNGTFLIGSLMQKNSLSVNSTQLMVPVLSQTQQTSAKNVRVSHAKSPSQLVQSTNLNPQDIPPPMSGRPSKLNFISSNNNNMSQNQSIIKNNVQTKQQLLGTSNTTKNLMHNSQYPQKLQKSIDLRSNLSSQNNNYSVSNNNSINSSNNLNGTTTNHHYTSKLPYIQPPISARVSNKYPKDLSCTNSNTTTSNNIKSDQQQQHQDDFKKITMQFKKQLSKITSNSNNDNNSSSSGYCYGNNTNGGQC